MLTKTLLIAFACGCVSAAFAQPKVPEHVFYQKLQNGLEVLVLEDHTIPFTTIEIACKNGSFTEDPEYNGLSHLYEHLFFKSNKDYRSEESYMKAMDDLDIAYNGRTQEEVVTYFVTLPKDNTEKGMNFMNSAIRYPVFKNKDMLKEDNTVNSEFQRQESNPYYVLIDTLNHLLWGDNYSRKNIIGNHDIILSATPEKMEVIRNKYYYPNNCLLIFAGDVEHTDILPKANDIFGSWKASKTDPVADYPIPQIQPLQQNQFAVIESPLAQSPLFVMRWQGPDMRNDIQATYTADVFSYIVNQRLSKLTEALEDKGLATGVSVNYYSQKYVGPITVSFSPNPDKLKECYEVLQNEIAQWDSDDYITDKQIERAKRVLYISQVEEREEVQTYTDLMAFWWASASIDYYTSYRDNLNKVTRQDIKDYIRTYIKGKPFCAGLIVPQGTDMNVANHFYTTK